jgi:hypothetical protein
VHFPEDLLEKNAPKATPRVLGDTMQNNLMQDLSKKLEGQTQS